MTYINTIHHIYYLATCLDAGINDREIWYKRESCCIAIFQWFSKNVINIEPTPGVNVVEVQKLKITWNKEYTTYSICNQTYFFILVIRSQRTQKSIKNSLEFGIYNKAILIRKRRFRQKALILQYYLVSSSFLPSSPLSEREPDWGGLQPLQPLPAIIKRLIRTGFEFHFHSFLNYFANNNCLEVNCFSNV